MLNRPYTVPRTGEKRPAELLDISGLRWGPPIRRRARSTTA